MVDVLKEGAFARKQIGSRSRLIAWSHSARFRVGLELGGTFAGKRVLDYGCGDGTYLALLAGSDAPPAECVGAEIAEDFVRGNQERFAGNEKLRFIRVDELDAPERDNSFDAVVCMEVLEHVLNPDQFLDNFHRWLAPGGILLLSVPVEIGLSVVIKQAVRQINGWRGIGDYPGTTSYTWGEMVRAVFAGPTQHVERPIHRNPDGSEFHDHKGFNWRLLRRKIQDRFELLDERSSPVAWLPAWVASQMWFKARKRA